MRALSPAHLLLNTCKGIGLIVNTGKTKYMEVGRHRGMANVNITMDRIGMKK